ncbi:gluconate 2-dehydrogenase subunit 3 family protein [Occallatibacter riparius]|uniref:Gluconate 2-dehydrogenase subunit 3 family protein n=1 Tax=Occallatibacter riparius TaxID=1002689 RepID=A0A9J7BSF7_9BACT|nr:gluconate 2-dehydrogenase subunit 3 family protein [Occallatibacter riparius]UWZ85812.1 gluconate 2-dehydrogenase subunit 3 family protein [Occallatibacter riparius]
MTLDPVSRRAVLKSLTMSVAAGSVLRVIPAQAAEHAHHAIEAEKAAGAYTPKFFDAQGYKTLQALSDAILPPDADSGGAVEGGAPEFIDLLASENTEYQAELGGFLRWLDATCTSRYGKPWIDCTKGQQTEILDQVAYRKNAEQDPSLEKPIAGFAFLRNFVADGFFTSKIGIRYLGYKGNTYLTEFPGCPPVPGV